MNKKCRLCQRNSTIANFKSTSYSDFSSAVAVDNSRGQIFPWTEFGLTVESRRHSDRPEAAILEPMPQNALPLRRIFLTPGKQSTDDDTSRLPPWTFFTLFI